MRCSLFLRQPLVTCVHALTHATTKAAPRAYTETSGESATTSTSSSCATHRRWTAASPIYLSYRTEKQVPPLATCHSCWCWYLVSLYCVCKLEMARGRITTAATALLLTTVTMPHTRGTPKSLKRSSWVLQLSRRPVSLLLHRGILVDFLRPIAPQAVGDEEELGVR